VPDAIPPNITVNVLTTPSSPPYIEDLRYYPASICYYL
jgi:hypothetical protein